MAQETALAGKYNGYDKGEANKTPRGVACIKFYVILPFYRPASGRFLLLATGGGSAKNCRKVRRSPRQVVCSLSNHASGALHNHCHRSSVVEHTLGKGEVTGSNPVGGLKNTRQLWMVLDCTLELNMTIVMLPVR